MKAFLEMRIADWPEALWCMRRELAAMLRRVAAAEADPRVARRLVEIASVFETGQPIDG